jgi:hypothetical protein
VLQFSSEEGEIGLKGGWLLEQSSSCNFDLSQKNASSSIEDLEINNPFKCSLDSSYVFHLNSWNLQTDH